MSNEIPKIVVRGKQIEKRTQGTPIYSRGEFSLENLQNDSATVSVEKVLCRFGETEYSIEKYIVFADMPEYPELNPAGFTVEANGNLDFSISFEGIERANQDHGPASVEVFLSSDGTTYHGVCEVKIYRVIPRRPK